MFLETVESEGLAHLSYLLGDESEGVALVIDPRRDFDVYLDLARHRGVRITHVLESHIHADFASGATGLASHVGAEILVSANGNYDFPARRIREGDEIRIGKLLIQVVESPGHTPEHVSFLVRGGLGAEASWGLFTGDVLFAGEVGRPDLGGAEQAESLARKLHHTLFEKFLPLGDGVQVYPAHGKGSPCGASIGDRLTSTIGYERHNNEKLQAKGEEEFVRKLLSGLPPAPAYYSRMKQLNAAGTHGFAFLPVIQPLPPHDFYAERKRPDALVLDTREIEAFGGAHIDGALNIPLRQEFPVWTGWMLRPGQRLLLVLERKEDLEEVQRHLLRIGIDSIGGFLHGGMRNWIEEGFDFVRPRVMSVHELKRILDDGKSDLQILDVRSDAEWDMGRIPTAKHLFVPHLEESGHGILDPSKPILTYCGTGYRASIAASALERMGFLDVRNLPGSMQAWKAANYELEEERRN